ncbi:16194_t:CDS:2, partial [Dentiscutata heterogama]
MIQNCSDEVANGSSGIFVSWRSRKLSNVEKTHWLIGFYVGLKYRELDLDVGEKYQDHDMIIRLNDINEEVFIEFSEMSNENSEGHDVEACRGRLA